MITLENVTKQYPGGHKAIDNLSLEIPAGTTVTLIGPSGCGKTTTMRLMNRLEQATSGRVVVAGRDVMASNPIELRRMIGYVIQQIGLFPHMTVARNIAAVPRLLGWDRKRIDARIDELLELVGLENAMRHRLPHQLSGGQRQRVGVARAMAADPPVMLMDEPFGAIDPITRVRLQDEFKRILQRFGKTVVFVTHDLEEAIKMGDRVAIMRDGKLLQYDTPDNILSKPADAFVESFVGADRALKRLNLLRAAEMVEPMDGKAPAARNVAHDATLLEVLSLMLAEDLPAVGVVDGEGAIIGRLDRERLFAYQSAR